MPLLAPVARMRAGNIGFPQVSKIFASAGHTAQRVALTLPPVAAELIVIAALDIAGVL
jgi:hypothetical protein